MDMPPDCRAWVAEVDRVMKRDWAIDTADAGLDDADLIRHWRDGQTPEAYVAWHAEKYDLIDFRTDYEPNHALPRATTSR